MNQHAPNVFGIHPVPPTSPARSPLAPLSSPARCSIDSSGSDSRRRNVAERLGDLEPQEPSISFVSERSTSPSTASVAAAASHLFPLAASLEQCEHIIFDLLGRPHHHAPPSSVVSNAHHTSTIRCKVEQLQASRRDRDENIPRPHACGGNPLDVSEESFGEVDNAVVGDRLNEARQRPP